MVQLGVHWGLQDGHAVLVDDPQLQFGFTPADRKQSVTPAHIDLTAQHERAAALPAPPARRCQRFDQRLQVRQARLGQADPVLSVRL